MTVLELDLYRERRNVRKAAAASLALVSVVAMVAYARDIAQRVRDAGELFAIGLFGAIDLWNDDDEGEREANANA